MASSSIRVNLDYKLERFDLRRYFEFTVAGDEVVSLTDPDSGRHVDLARLDPAEIASIYPLQKEDRTLVRIQDVPDLRDWPFEPSLGGLRRYLTAPRGLHILAQGEEGACTGFGLAAVINLLNRERGNRALVSPRMLYEMAKLHDEWPGEEYAGSSCRGAIKGWYNMGVCRDSKWPYAVDRPGAGGGLFRRVRCCARRETGERVAAWVYEYARDPAGAPCIPDGRYPGGAGPR